MLTDRQHYWKGKNYIPPIYFVYRGYKYREIFTSTSETTLIKCWDYYAKVFFVGLLFQMFETWYISTDHRYTITSHMYLRLRWAKNRQSWTNDYVNNWDRTVGRIFEKLCCCYICFHFVDLVCRRHGNISCEFYPLKPVLIFEGVKFKTRSLKGNDRSPVGKQVFLNSYQVSKIFFQFVKGS